MRLPLVCGAALVLCLGAAGRGHAASQREDGRRHAQKASRLAAQGKCRRAIPEYTAAYQLLHDPALLFNRAECLRKVGDKNSALFDYRQFLEGLPGAPNRAEVEARITELGGTPPPAPVVPPPAAAPVPPRAASGEPPAAGIPPTAAPSSTEPATPGATPANGEPATPGGGASAGPVTPGPGSSEPAAPAEPAPGADAANAGPPAPEPEPAPAPVLPAVPLIPEVPRSPGLELTARPAPAPAPGSSAWVWVGASALVLAIGAVGAWYAFGRSRTDVPLSSLGNYHF